jgi:hypothetical protein
MAGVVDNDAPRSGDQRLGETLATLVVNDVA